jgi:hypothetical protein
VLGGVPGPDLLHFVLDGQLASLELRDLEVVYRRVQKRLVDLALEVDMLTPEFRKMGFKRHGRLSLQWFLVATVKERLPPTVPPYDGTMTVWHDRPALSNARL